MTVRPRRAGERGSAVGRPRAAATRTEELDAPNPTGRVADAREVAGLVAHLLGAEAAFVTGAALAIDGGATAR